MPPKAAAAATAAAVEKEPENAFPQLEKLVKSIELLENIDVEAEKIADVIHDTAEDVAKRFKKIEEDIAAAETKGVAEHLAKLNQVAIDESEHLAMMAGKAKVDRQTEAKRRKLMDALPKEVTTMLCVKRSEYAADHALLDAQATSLENQKKVLVDTLAELRRNIEAQKILTRDIANAASSNIPTISINWSAPRYEE
ncbi:hypothetical protein DIPPA_02701 [Diplonema papillatum]|nr:hypothetical protein DIPPA_02701 [Diplonema papillatum]|eukprot:gene12418-19207_t